MDRRELHEARRGIKPDKQCAGCSKTAPAKSGTITRHHLLPKASSKRWRENKNKSGIKTIPLCTDCHKLVHETWGHGKDFTGPTDAQNLIDWLKNEIQN